MTDDGQETARTEAGGDDAGATVRDIAAKALARTLLDDSARRTRDPGLTIKGGAAPELDDATVLSSIGSPSRAAMARAGSARPDVEYQIVEKLGHGGMGIVFRAWQADLERDVALKTMRDELVHDEDRRRDFLAEAVVTGALDHPNIVPVHTLEDPHDASPYFAMKLVEGRPWSDLFEGDQAVDLERHLEIMRAVTHAVAYAHAKGLLHRDIKPSNVMVGDYGEVLLMDWGLACRFGAGPERAVEPRGGGVSGQRDATSVTCVEGTPAYMAPEMARGEGRSFGPWTDVYVLGGILFEILTGRKPHAGGSVQDVVFAAAEAQSPDLDENAPSGLRQICAKAMAPAIEDRHQTAEEFLEALRAYGRHRESEVIADSARHLMRAAAEEVEERAAYADYQRAIAGFEQSLTIWPENETAIRDAQIAHRLFAELAIEHGDLGLAATHIEALDETGDLRTRHDVAVAQQASLLASGRRQRRLLIAAAIIVVAGAAVAFALVVKSRNQERDAKQNALRLAERNERLVAAEREVRAQAESDAETARQVAGFLVDIFEESDPVAQSSRAFGAAPSSASLSAREVLDRGAQRLRDTLRDSPLVRAELLDTIGTVYLNLGLVDEGEPLVTEAFELRRANLPDPHLDLSRSLQSIAMLHSARGERRADEFERIVAMRRKLVPDDHPLLAQARFFHVAALLAEWRLEEARESMPAALDAAQRAHGERSREAAFILLCRAQLTLLENRPAAALPDVTTAAGIIDEARGNDDLTALLRTFMSAQVAQGMGQNARADRLYEETVTRGELALGKSHFLVAHMIMRHGELLNRWNRDIDRAAAMNQQALEAYRRAYGERHRLISGRLLELARSRRAQGRQREAMELCDEAIDIARSCKPPALSDVGAGLHIRGMQLFRRGELEDARDDVRDAVTAYHEDGSKTAMLGHSLRDLGMIALRIEGEAEAEYGILGGTLPDGKQPMRHVARMRACLRAARLFARSDEFVRESLERLALGSLEDAVDAGFADRKALEAMEELAPFMEREDWRATLDRLR